MADIRINALPLATGPTAPTSSDNVAIDGANTRKSTLSGLADAIRPIASQAEAEEGSNSTKGMSPLTTAQAIAAQALVPSNIGTSVQAFSANLTTLSSVAPGAAGSSVLGFSLADDIRAFLDTPPYVATRTDLKALVTTKDLSAFLNEGQRQGFFKWMAGDYSALVASDPLEGIYIASSITPSTSGAWVRQAGFALEGVKPEWFGAIADGSTDCRAAVQAALNMGYNIWFGFGTYDFYGPALVKTTGQEVIGSGPGYGYGSPNVALKDYITQTRLRARGTFARRIMTRRKPRASIADPQDATLSAMLELHADGAKVKDIQVDLYCDYTNTSPTNFGDDVDVGIFVGCRVGVQIQNVNVTGYFRKVGVYWDVTRDPIQLPELLDPDGNPLPKGASGASFRGGDGCQVWNLYVRGARVAEAFLGPVIGGANYYDQQLGSTVPDRRGASGFSDLNQYGGRLYPGGHHSGRRLANPIISPLTRAGMESEDDFAPAALYIDGWSQNSGSTTHGVGAIRGFVFHGVRFASPEIFRVRFGVCDEVYFTGRAWSENGTNGGTFANVAGTTIDTNDYVNNTYGHFSDKEGSTGAIDIAAVAGGIFQPWISSLTRFSGRQSDGTVRERYAVADQFNIADDTVITITPPVLGGWMHITKSPANAPIFNQSVMLYFDSGSSLDIKGVTGAIGTNVTLALTDLTNGTADGVDGNLNVSVQAGVIKVKNRTGSTGLWRYRFL